MSDDPPQHLLGGLDVAIMTAPGSNVDQVDAAKISLEELGVNVTVVGPMRGSVSAVRNDGSSGTLQVAQRVSLLDPDAFDAVLLIADAEGARKMSNDEVVRKFLSGMNAEGKPIGAVDDGVLPLLATGLARSRTVSAPDHLAPAAEDAGAVAVGDSMSVSANVVSVKTDKGLESFNSALKHLLAQRRLATITPDNDTPSAVGEDA